MACESYENVNYKLIDNSYYIVGINGTVGSGIVDKKFAGEITIPRQFNKKEILEIGANAFQTA